MQLSRNEIAFKTIEWKSVSLLFSIWIWRACVRARISHIHWLVSFACLAVHCWRRHILMFTASTTSGKLAIKFELLFLNLFAECVRNRKTTTSDSFDSVKERGNINLKMENKNRWIGFLLLEVGDSHKFVDYGTKSKCKNSLQFDSSLQTNELIT